MKPTLSSLLLFTLVSQVTLAAEPGPCTTFTWDVPHELAVAKQTPQALSTAAKPDAAIPLLQLDRLYELKLNAQSAVSFVLTPGKATSPDGAQAGLVHFRTGKAGRYRVGITSGHWVDVVDHGKLIQSRDFQGARGCERPRKIVEYELPASTDLTLQLSGASDAAVILSVTAVSGR